MARDAVAVRAVAPALLLDEALLREQRGIRREVQVGSKSPVLVAPDRDRPWEYCGAGMTRRIHLYGTVLYDDLMGKYRMWYMGRMGPHWRFPAGNYQIPGLYIPRTDERPFHCNGVTHDRHGRALQNNDRGDLTLYAESDDGLAWVKPNLGIFTFNGSPDNNIVWDLHGASVFIDRAEPDAEKRYKAIGQTRSSDPPGMQLHLYYSGDGFVWTPAPHNPVMDTTPEPGRWGPTHYMGWDPIRKVYAVHIENCLHRACPLGQRIVGRAESLDLKNWSQPQNILLPDERDHVDTEFYNFPVVAYEGVYIALPWIFRTTNNLHYPTLAFSRNGVHYERKFREPLVRNGDHGSFDEVSIYCSAPILHDGKVWIYYTGANWRGPQQLFYAGESAIRAPGLATLPEDGFVSIDAGKLRPGILLTHPFSFEGTTLAVNLEAAPHNYGAGRAEVKVEILDHQVQPLSGFSLDQSDPLTTTGTHQASWQGRSDLSELAGRSIQLRFWIRNAKLYSFGFK